MHCGPYLPVAGPLRSEQTTPPHTTVLPELGREALPHITPFGVGVPFLTPPASRHNGTLHEAAPAQCYLLSVEYLRLGLAVGLDAANVVGCGAV